MGELHGKLPTNEQFTCKPSQQVSYMCSRLLVKSLVALGPDVIPVEGVLTMVHRIRASDLCMMCAYIHNRFFLITKVVPPN